MPARISRQYKVPNFQTSAAETEDGITTGKKFNENALYKTKYSRATSRVNWLIGEKNNVSRTISVQIPQYPEDGDRDGRRNVGFFAA
jgi:hypothetical protein